MVYGDLGESLGRLGHFFGGCGLAICYGRGRKPRPTRYNVIVRRDIVSIRPHVRAAKPQADH